MESVASFNAAKAGKAYIIEVLNLRPDGDGVMFQFDTGESVSLIGLNTITDDDTAMDSLKNIIEAEIKEQGILPSPDMPKTVTEERLEIYPCKCEGVSVSDTAPITFYFHNIFRKN